MTDPELFRRSRRRAARVNQRARWRRLVSSLGAFIVVLAAVAVALVLTNVITVPGGSDAHTNTAASNHPSSTTSRPDRGPHHRRLTPDDPLRLWIAGDSLAGSIGPSLGELTAKTGVVQPQYDSRVSSGLLNPDFYNWPKHAEEQLALLDPEVVVFIIGTNDANVWNDRLTADYRARTEAMMHTLVGAKHRQVFWVGAPVARAKTLETGVLAVDAIQRDAAANVAGVTYVDAHAIFDDENGDYQQSFPDENGTTRIMRAGDGVHFSVEGADFISRAIFDLIDTEWNLTAQTVPGATKPVLETKGSTQVPGTHRSVGASVSDGSPTSRPTSDTSTTTTSSTSPSSTTSSSTTTTSPTTATTATIPPGP